MQSVIDKLNRLSEFRAQRDILNLDKQSAIDTVLTPEIKAKLAEIEVEFGDKAQAVVENMATLEAEIKVDVLATGETVRGTNLMAVWSRGRVSWDDRGLQGYMKSHPEIADFRKQSDPSISIRVNSKE